MPSDTQIVLRTLPRVHRACRSPGFAGDARGLRVSEHQARILAHLDENDPTMVTELADAMGVTPSTMSLNLGRLAAAGLIVRAPDPEDRRVKNVRLTPAGARVRDAAGELDIDRVDALMRRLDPDERHVAVRGLVALAEAADAVLSGSRGVGRP